MAAGLKIQVENIPTKLPGLVRRSANRSGRVYGEWLYEIKKLDASKPDHWKEFQIGGILIAGAKIIGKCVFEIPTVLTLPPWSAFVLFVPANSHQSQFRASSFRVKQTHFPPVSRICSLITQIAQNDQT